ncbi:MAG: hypothetical protein AB2L14_25370 [Candidatus Xenobiia bacterium LiM19]
MMRKKVADMGEEERERYRKRRRQYYIKNREEILSKVKQYQEKNREWKSEYHKDYKLRFPSITLYIEKSQFEIVKKTAESRNITPKILIEQFIVEGIARIQQ